MRLSSFSMPRRSPFAALLIVGWLSLSANIRAEDGAAESSSQPASDGGGGGEAVQTSPSSTSQPEPGPTTSTTSTTPTATASRVALGQPVSVNWDAANQTCTAQSQHLATRTEVCPSGAGSTPIVARPDGDVWMAVGDHANAWISIGTSYPERLCQLHEEVTGSAPTWGTDRGPEPETGQPTALLCLP